MCFEENITKLFVPTVVLMILCGQLVFFLLFFLLHPLVETFTEKYVFKLIHNIITGTKVGGGYWGGGVMGADALPPLA